MDGILALCHFCETHGPCVILCTQKCSDDPCQYPHTLTVPWCEACRSIEVNHAFVSRESEKTYVTTRTPQKQELAFLLKQAAVRGLSCEEEINKDGGIMYFGDNERGHAINYSFTLKDSLARGFHRKYSLLMLTQDKLLLLNMWPTLVHNMKKLIDELQIQADEINKNEQKQCSQRAVRQAQGSPKIVSRSLPQLTGQPAIFGHIHLWFTWILSYEITIEKFNSGLLLPQSSCPKGLQKILLEMEDEIFRIAMFCVLTGYKLEAEENIIKSFKILLPQEWEPLGNTSVCKIKKDIKWFIEWPGCLPSRLPTLQIIIEKALKDERLPQTALEPFLHANIIKWFNIVRSLVWSNGINNKQLLKVLGVQSHDMPLINYWVICCNSTIK